MPRETLTNLPEDKRNRVRAAAMREFAARPYDQANLGAIAAAAGVSKGSLFQYFEDKFDLYTWLMQVAGEQKAALVAAQAHKGDLFATLRASYAAGLTFLAQDPEPAAVGLRLLEPSAEPRLEALRRAVQAQTHAWLLAQLRAAPDLRPDLDLDAAAWLALGTLRDGLLQGFLARAGTWLGDPEAAQKLGTLSPDDAWQLADQAVTLLERGLRA